MKPNIKAQRETLVTPDRQRCDVGLREPSPTYACWIVDDLLKTVPELVKELE